MFMFKMTIRSNRQFPLFMLYSDSCWPYLQRDVGLIEESLMSVYHPDNEERDVTVMCYRSRKKLSPWTVEKWEAYGWKVVEVSEGVKKPG